MLTKSDLKQIKELIVDSHFILEERLETRLEERLEKKFNGKIDTLKQDLVKFKDEILHEIISLRDEVTIVVGYRGMLEDHETRLDKLETKPS